MVSSVKINGLIVLVSALLWVLTFQLHAAWLPFLSHAPGIDLIFMPSGVRLLLLMIGGPWAASGVALGSAFLVDGQFGISNLGVTALIALVSGFGPYAALRLTQRLFGISPSLGNLAAWHLPVISLAMGIGSSVIHNLLFALLGLESWSNLPDNLLAMAMGDFLGSFLLIVLAVGSLRLYRRINP